MMKKYGWVWVAVVILLINVGACATAVSYVPIREAKFRTETTRENRMSLPLTKETRERLVRFLRAGGDRDREGVDVVDPDAETRYAALLNLLEDPHSLNLEDLTEKDTFTKWFPEPPLRQVIDAREEAPPAIDPVAVTDGNYWWIFYHQHKRLTGLLVMRAIRSQLGR